MQRTSIDIREPSGEASPMGLIVDGYNVLESQAQGMRTVNMEMTLCMNVTDDFPIPQR